MVVGFAEKSSPVSEWASKWSRATGPWRFATARSSGRGDGVVAAHDHRDGPGVEHARDGGFDALEGLVEIAGDDIHIARVDALAVLENIHVKNAVVGLQDAGGIPDGNRAEPASWPI